MSARWWKEIRLVWPAWLVALVLAAAAPWMAPPGEAPIVMQCLLVLALVTLAVTSFGREFSQRTFALWLVQPVSRSRLWAEKVLVLALALGSVAAMFLWSWRVSPGWDFDCSLGRVRSTLVWTAVVLAAAMAGGLWTTLLFHQVTPALWFTVLAPCAIALEILQLGERFRLRETQTALLTAVVLGLYSVAGFAWARRRFLRAQDVQWLGGDFAVRGWPWRLGAGRGRLAGTGRRSPTWALFEKELHLQQLAALGVLGYLVVCTLAALSGSLLGLREFNLSILEPAAVLGCGFIAMLIGAVAIAEERRLGTLDLQRGLPIAPLGQFTLKLLAAYVTALLLAGVLPWALFLLAGIKTGNTSGHSLGLLGWFVLSALGVTTLAFYASSLTRSTLQAVGLTLAVPAGITLIVAAAVQVVPDARAVIAGLGRAVAMKLSGTWWQWYPPMLWSGSLGYYIGIPVAVALCWRLAYTNSLRLGDGQRLWLQNLRAVVLAGLGVCVVTTAVYWRAWELFPPGARVSGPAWLETRSTAAPRWNPNPLPGLASTADALYVLLPDGRLWAKGPARAPSPPPLATTETSTHVPSGSIGQESVLSRPGFQPNPAWVSLTQMPPGAYVPGSNWVAVSASSAECCGLKTDGSLWRLQGPATAPVRLGGDTDWRAISAGTAHFLALKKDGSLWAWGDNRASQLGDGTPPLRMRYGVAPAPRNPAGDNQATNTRPDMARAGSDVAVKSATNSPPQWLRTEPVRIGNDSDWVLVNGFGTSSAGVKADGSVWRWGSYFAVTPDGNFEPRHSDSPARCGQLPWRDARALLAGDGWLGVLRADGSAWVQSQHDPNDWQSDGELARWRSWACGSAGLMGLDAEGAVSFLPMYWRGLDRPARPIRFTRPDRWAVVLQRGRNLVALGVDGSLWGWGTFGSETGRSLLGPSRRPRLIDTVRP